MKLTYTGHVIHFQSWCRSAARLYNAGSGQKDVNHDRQHLVCSVSCHVTLLTLVILPLEALVSCRHVNACGLP